MTDWDKNMELFMVIFRSHVRGKKFRYNLDIDHKFYESTDPLLDGIRQVF
jgi:hypothetical protein